MILFVLVGRSAVAHNEGSGVVALFQLHPLGDQLRVKTVNLAEIATGFSGEAKVASHYKRLQRFFRDFELDDESIALMVVKVI